MSVKTDDDDDDCNSLTSTNNDRILATSSCVPLFVTDLCVGDQYGVRNASTTIKIRENESINSNPKYSFVLTEKTNSMSEKVAKPNIFTFEISAQNDSKDTISDAETYIIEDDESEQKLNSSPSGGARRYGNGTKDRKGTFDIHGLISGIAHTVHRPVVDSNIPKDRLSSGSSSRNSSVHSYNESEDISENQSSSIPQKQIKPAESFVISPTFATKPFVNQKKSAVPLKSTSSTKNTTFDNPTTRSFVQQSVPSVKTSVSRPQTSTFQRSTVEKTSPTSNLSNKSTVTSQQRSSLAPPPNRQPLKPVPSTPAATATTTTATNRAVELRRAQAKAKIEELAQRTKKALPKSKQQPDIMSVSWHPNLMNTNKKDSPKTNKQDLSTTRTISSSIYPRSTSTSTDGKKITKNTHDVDEARCDLLRNSGQRLAIKLIQLSSGILEKLKPTDDVTLEELEQVVDQLQTVNRTLTSIDASLTGSSKDDPFA